MEHTAMPASEAVPQIIEILERGQQCMLTVTGSSMLPFLRHKKDAVVLAKPEPQMLRRGRVVFFQRESGAYILHRIRRVEKDGSLCINGDAQAWTEHIRPEQVLAVVVAIRRKSGRILDCNGILWRGLSALWYPTRPIRGQLLPICFHVRAIFQRKSRRTQ